LLDGGSMVRLGSRESVPCMEALALMAADKQVEGKLRYALIPSLGLAELALVYTIGAKKYSDNNWRKGLPFTTCLDAAMRHLEMYRSGENRCPQDKQHHLASVIFWCMALIEFERAWPDLDDRIK